MASANKAVIIGLPRPLGVNVVEAASSAVESSGDARSFPSSAVSFACWSRSRPVADSVLCRGSCHRECRMGFVDAHMRQLEVSICAPAALHLDGVIVQ